jgi:uncharacterized protein (DUF302 family)
MHIVRMSRLSYQDTVSHLSGSIVSAGNTIFLTLDQTAAAAALGLRLRPTTLIVFGNPKGGTPLMDAFPSIALELPLKLAVWQEDDGVRVACTLMSEIASRYGVIGHEPAIAAMDAALRKLADSVV